MGKDSSVILLSVRTSYFPKSGIINHITTSALARKNGEPALACLKFEDKLGNVYEKQPNKNEKKQ